ncbi:hypothetical protein AB6A40_010305 [Gnathostoma spinigerum]|uniref:Uncharacterized protein n=1 Tax=Gnathostoma spinigerum TaxID=75299 RepID=A0ABD6EW68_9BILA
MNAVSSLPVYQDQLYHPFYSSDDVNSNLYYGSGMRPPVLLKENECQCPIPPQTPRPVSTIVVAEPSDICLSCCSIPISPSSLDRYSRSMFPLIFVIFNSVYWTYFMIISRKHSDEEELY